MAKQPKSRRPKFSLTQVIAVLEATGANITLAATRLGCSRTTIRTYAERHREVAEAIERIKAEFVDLAETQLKILVRDKNPQAVFFALKTLGKARGYSERTEVTTPPGTPIEVSQSREFDYSKLGDQELRLLFALLARAKGRPSHDDDDLVRHGILPLRNPGRS